MSGELDVAMRLRLINMLSGPANAAERDINDISRAAQRLNGARAGGRLAGDLGRISREASQAERHLKALSRTHIIADEMAGRFGAGGMMAMGARAGVAGVAILGLSAAMGGAAKEAIQFETAMAEVRKAVDLDPAAFERLQETILKISRTTGMTKEQVAQLTAQAGFAGRPAEDLTRFATFAAKAAIAFDMTAEAAGDGLAKLGNIFKLTQTGIEDVADAINLLGDNTASKEREVVDFLQRVGASAKTFGLSADRAAAFGAAIISLGTTPEIAATGFNALLSKLQTASKQGKEFQGGLKALGLSGKQVEEMIRKGPAEAILEVMERINKLEPTKRAGVLADMFGAQYADDMARLAGSTELLRRALSLVADQSKRAGGVEKTFDIFNATTEAKIKRVSAQVAALGTNLGNVVTPALGRAADALSDVLEKINAAFDKQRELTRRTPEDRAFAGAADKVSGAEAELNRREQELKQAEGSGRLTAPARQALQRRIEAARRELETARGERDKALKDVPHVPRALDAAAWLPNTGGVPMPRQDPRFQWPQGLWGTPAPVPGEAHYRAQREAERQQERVAEIEGRIRDREAQLEADAARYEAQAKQPGAGRMRGRFQTQAEEARAAIETDQELRWLREELARLMRNEQQKQESAPAEAPKNGGVPSWDPDAIQKNHFGPGPKDAQDAGKQAASAFEQGLTGQMDRVEQEVAAFSKRLQAMLSFTATPTISPRFSGAADAPSATSPGAPPASGGDSGAGREARASIGRARSFASVSVPTTVHIHGISDPATLGRELARIQDQRVRQARNGALHDTGAIA